MRHRIHSALLFANENPRPEKPFEAQTWDLATNALLRNNNLNWNLLDIPFRLRIKTIDSFCHYVAKQFMFDKVMEHYPINQNFHRLYTNQRRVNF